MSTTNEMSPWAGQTLSDVAVALFPDLSLGQLVAGSSECTDLVSVQPEELHDFITQHSGVDFLSIEVDRLFWNLDQILHDPKNSLARAALRQLVDEGKWIDVLLLKDQVCKACQNHARPIPPEILEFNSKTNVTAKNQIRTLFEVYDQLKVLSQSLTQAALVILPLQNYEYLAREKPKVSKHNG